MASSTNPMLQVKLRPQRCFQLLFLVIQSTTHTGALYHASADQSDQLTCRHACALLSATFLHACAPIKRQSAQRQLYIISICSTSIQQNTVLTQQIIVKMSETDRARLSTRLMTQWRRKNVAGLSCRTGHFYKCILVHLHLPLLHFEKIRCTLYQLGPNRTLCYILYVPLIKK